MMEVIASKLTDQDILDAATYLATAPRTTDGGSDYTSFSAKTQ
jgi:cytochrome c553